VPRLDAGAVIAHVDVDDRRAHSAARAAIGTNLHMPVLGVYLTAFTIRLVST
jgi:hypothetical protein